MLYPHIKGIKRLNSILLFTVLLSSNAHAAVFTYTEGYFLSGSTAFTENQVGFLGVAASNNLQNIPQFSPSQGSLESVNVSINGFLSFESVLSDNGINDPNSGSFGEAIFDAGIGLITPIGGSQILEATALQTQTTSCSEGPGAQSCLGFGGGNFDVSSSVLFTGTDIDGFLGSGDLADSRLALLGGLNVPTFLDNLNGATLDIFDIEFDGNVTVEYTTSAVPVPAAIWLFASTIIGLGCTKRRKQ